MTKINRRNFLHASAATGSAAVLPAGALMAATAAAAQAPAASPAPAAPPEVTHILARYVAASRYEDLPANARKEATRTLLNTLAVTVGGSHEDAAQKAIESLSPYCGPAKASVIGREERVDILNAALFNGISSHVLDFDDTHPPTNIHPGGPVVSAILALAEQQPVSGQDFLNALTIGIEVECRIGKAVYPNHYDVGWHITTTCGVFGAAAACGRLLGLDPQKMTWALGLAAVQPVGLREMFGTMTKSFHCGRAAQNGLTAALLARDGFDSSEHGLEAPRGWGKASSTKQDWSQVVDNLGKTYEVTLNTYKPYACGLVTHPAVQAAIALRNENKLTADQIDRIDLRVNSLAIEQTGDKAPATGLAAKFSIYHAVAAAIVEGAAGTQQFTDRAVRDPTILALRGRVFTTIDPAIKSDQVRETITLKDGRRLERFIEHATGSPDAPMSDADLEAKFMGLADGVLPPTKAKGVIDLIWKIETLPDAGAIARAARA